jgi:hypothetical protein
MVNVRKRGGWILCFLGGVLSTTPAKAQLTLSWQYYAFGGPYNSQGGSGTFVANGGVGGTFIDYGGSSYFNIIADATSITFDYSVLDSPGPYRWAEMPLSKPPTIHNGIAIDVVSGPAFQSVTLDPATNMDGFDASRFSFTASEIQVDWQNLPFDMNTKVKLATQHTPEPGTIAFLAAFALTGVTFLRRKP